MTAPTLPPPTTAAGPRRPEPEPTRLARAVRGARHVSARWRSSLRVGPWLLGPLAALWAAAIGLALAIIPMLVMWMASADTGLTWVEGVRLGGLVWLAAQAAPVTVGGITLSLVPWGLVLVPIGLLAYAGGWAIRRTDPVSWREVAILSVSGAAVYAVVAGLVAWGTAAAGSSVAPARAIGTAFVVALLSLGFGTARSAAPDLPAATPPWLLVVVRAGLVGALALIGFGALAATVSLVAHVDEAVTMTQSVAGGLGGGLALVLIGVAYVPVLAVWGAAYVMGAGVVIGPSITVSPFIAVTAPATLPPLPLLAALPQAASPMAWSFPLVGVLAGVLAGVLIGRQARAEGRLVRLAMAAGSAVVAGAVLAVAAFLASGALGTQQLAYLGPMPLTVGVLGAVLIVIGAAPSAVVPSPPDRPALQVADTPIDAAEGERTDD